MFFLLWSYMMRCITLYSFFCCIVTLYSGFLFSGENSRLCKHGHTLILPGLTEPGKIVRSIVEDVVCVNLNVLSFDTFKIVVSIFPFVLVARMVDGRLQNCFYDRAHHKNINQLRDACRQFSEHSIVYPVFLASALSLGARDEDLKATGRMFLKGLPSVLLVSDFIKKFDVELVGRGCLRPWNEHFSYKKRSRGGFPSGHLTSTAYAATLFGVRYGAKWAVPLGAITAAVGISFLNCNRHYLSQIFAGIALGAIYGVAASKQVDIRLEKQRKACSFDIQTDIDAQGNPAVKFGVTF